MRVAACLSAGIFLLAAPAMGATNPASQGDNKLVCKKSVETGSLVKARKVCRTKAEWRKVTETARKTTRDIQDLGSRIAGPGG